MPNKREYQFRFTGWLKLSIEGDYRGRKRWADGSRGRVEQKLESFIHGVVQAAQAVGLLRLEREDRARRWEEQRKQWEAAEERRRHREDFAQNLVKEADAWQRFVSTRAYVRHLHAQLTETDLPTT